MARGASKQKQSRPQQRRWSGRRKRAPSAALPHPASLPLLGIGDTPARLFVTIRTPPRALRLAPSGPRRPGIRRPVTTQTRIPAAGARPPESQAETRRARRPPLTDPTESARTRADRFKNWRRVPSPQHGSAARTRTERALARAAALAPDAHILAPILRARVAKGKRGPARGAGATAARIPASASAAEEADARLASEGPRREWIEPWFATQLAPVRSPPGASVRLAEHIDPERGRLRQRARRRSVSGSFVRPRVVFCGKSDACAIPEQQLIPA
jgi:hypothetical protein